MERMDTSWLGPGEQRRFTRAEYDRLVELGMFEDERIELLHGFLVAKEPQGPDHSSIARRLHRLLLLALDAKAFVFCHSPYAASDDSEPEPDVAVVPKTYAENDHPSKAFFLAEIGKKSLRRDRGVKADLYASNGVPEYWVVDVPNGCVEVRTEPRKGRYTRLQTFRPGESVTLVAFPDVTIAVSDVLE